MFSETGKVLLFKTLHIAITVTVIAGITVVYSRMGIVNSTTVALSFVIVVLTVSTAWGLTEGVAASVSGAVCLSPFLPPIGVFWVGDLEHWVAFGTFLTASVSGGRMPETLPVQIAAPAAHPVRG